MERVLRPCKEKKGILLRNDFLSDFGHQQPQIRVAITQECMDMSTSFLSTGELQMYNYSAAEFI